MKTKVFFSFKQSNLKYKSLFFDLRGGSIKILTRQFISCPTLYRKSFSYCLTPTFALQSRAEPLEGSAHSVLCRGLGRHMQARQFSPIDISHHAHTACISIHNLSAGGHWGEEEREDNSTGVQWGFEPGRVI